MGTSIPRSPHRSPPCHQSPHTTQPPTQKAPVPTASPYVWTIPGMDPTLVLPSSNVRGKARALFAVRARALRRAGEWGWSVWHAPKSPAIAAIIPPNTSAHHV